MARPLAHSAPAPVESPLLTANEVAGYLRKSRSFVQDHRAELGGRKLGRSLMFHRADVDAFVERGRMRPEHPPAEPAGHATPTVLSDSRRIRPRIDLTGLPALNPVTGLPWGFDR